MLLSLQLLASMHTSIFKICAPQKANRQKQKFGHCSSRGIFLFLTDVCIYIIYISFKNVLRLSWRPMFSGIKVEVINSKALLIRHNQYCEILCTALAHCKGYRDSPGSSAGKNLPTMQETPV